ncbi:MAG: hypothetical protein EOP50_21365 [Sphingobacteriales bacterium]|nr:MAG: hypothetical protein EOP50_21365 [Sphingobacteriales bacterium]
MHYLRTLLFTASVLCARLAGAQHSDLYLRVDSIARFQLHFDSSLLPAPAVTVKDSPGRNAIAPKPAFRDVVQYPSYPLIIVNGVPVERGRLDRGRLALTRKITVLEKVQATAIYGYDGWWGAVYIEGNRQLARLLGLKKQKL